MRLVILGAGAIGGIVGGRLAHAGREVVLLARGAHLAAIRAHGLRMESPDGVVTVHPRSTERCEWRPGDVLLLAVKTQDATAALREHAPPHHVPIICLTNGIEAERIALRHASEVYGACVLMPGTHLSPGVVQVWASPVPGAIDLGGYPDGIGRGAPIVAELRAAGFASELRPEIMRWKRGKLISNLANGAEALCGPSARRSDLAERARAEARACFTAAGLAYTSADEDAERRAGFESKPIAGATRGGGSTWQSLARGASSLETDYLNGEIGLLGRMHGVPTPVNDALQHLSAEAARARVTPGSMSLDELSRRVAAFR